MDRVRDRVRDRDLHLDQDRDCSGGARPVVTVLPQSEPHYVAWMRARQLDQRRRQPLLSQRHAQADRSEAADVHGQERAWVERHSHERRLHESALAQLRHS